MISIPYYVTLCSVHTIYCRVWAVKREQRCRMHGGARRSGRPICNTNALKHGMYTEAALEVKKALRNLNREMKESLQEIDGG